jgi:chemotaxis protein methyltransferase CheR
MMPFPRFPAAYTMRPTFPAPGDKCATADAVLQISDADFARIGQYIYRETGIVITPAKRSMLVSRLSRRLRQLDLEAFSDYANLIEGHHGENERSALISAITTNVTGFFREPHHFKALVDIMPGLISRARSGGRVRLWSAGCSTGQEAYSMAATILDHAPDAVRLDLRILATDIDSAVVSEARRGVYPQRALGDNPPPQLSRMLRKASATGDYAVVDPLRSLIRFEVLNILQSWPFQGGFDVIFCRNVVIYFDSETRLRLWSRFADRIPPGGMLFLGHSERMDPQIDALFAPCGLTQYTRTTLAVSAVAGGRVSEAQTVKDPSWP